MIAPSDGDTMITPTSESSADVYRFSEGEWRFPHSVSGHAYGGIMHKIVLEGKGLDSFTKLAQITPSEPPQPVPTPTD